MSSTALSHLAAPAAAFSRSMRAAIALLVVAVVAIYGQVAGFAFLNWDDPTYVTENYDVLAGLSWEGLLWAFNSTAFSNWHPLTWLSHQAAWSAFGPWAGGHHLVNAGLHLANVLLCFVFLRQATGSHWRSLLVALLYAVHPLHVETVAWIADRKALLAATFWWMALLAWTGWVRQDRARFYVLALAMHACALLAKPMAVSFPMVLLALDLWPLGAASRARPASVARLLAEKLPFVVLSIIDAGMTYYAQNKGGAVVSGTLLPVVDRITNALVTYQDYLLALLWPTDLSFFYVYPANWPVWRVLLALLVGIGLLSLAWATRRTRPWVLAGLCWFVLMLGPVIGLVQVGSQSHADRYMYLSDIGLLIAIVWSLPAPPARRAFHAAALALVVIGTLGGLAARQAAYWRDSPTLYQRALQLDQGNYVAHLLLSEHLIAEGDVDRADRHARLSLAYNDSRMVSAYAHRVLARVALGRGALDEASDHLQTSMALMPSSPKAGYYKARIEAAAGRDEAAEYWLIRTLRINPRYPEALEALAYYYAERKRWAQAVNLQEKAASLRPWLDWPAIRLQWYRDEALRARTQDVPPL